MSTLCALYAYVVNVEVYLLSEQSDQEQQHQCADDSRDNMVDQTCADAYTHLTE